MVARARPDAAVPPPPSTLPRSKNGHAGVPEEVRTRRGSDTALPSLGPFAALLGQPYQRLKVAVLRELAALPSRWQLAEAQAALTWLESGEAGSLLAELEADGLIVPAGGGGGRGQGRSWKLSEEAQLVAAVCAVLAVPRIDPERMVKVLGAASGLAVAAGTEDQPALAPFLAAVSVLEADRERLHGLIREGAEGELLAVAHLARAHAVDLRALLERQRDDLLKLERGPRIATVLDRAGRLATRVELLASEIEAILAVGPDEVSQASLVPSPVELRALIGGLNPGTLARLLRREAVPLPLPVTVPPAAPTASALATLDRRLGREAPPRPAPLPAPKELPVEPMDVVPDMVAVAADALRWLATLDDGGDTPLAKWVVGGSWQEASSRMAAAVEAWSRWGPSGDGSLGIELEARPLVEPVGHDAIGVTSRTVIRSLPQEPKPEAEAEPPEPPDPLPEPLPDPEHE